MKNGIKITFYDNLKFLSGVKVILRRDSNTLIKKTIKNSAEFNYANAFIFFKT